MQTGNFTLGRTARAADAGLWFALPPGFTSLPMDVLAARPDPAQADALREAVRSLLDAMPDETGRQRLVAAVSVAQQALRAVHAEGAVHYSLGLHRDDTEHGTGDGLPLLSQFTITWVETTWAPRGVIAARAVARAEGHTGIAYDELACGPASFSEVVRTPAADSGLPQRPLLQLFAHLPHPDCTRLALLTLSTMALPHRELYRLILNEIAATVSFEDPFAEPAATGPRTDTGAGENASDR